MNTPGIAHHTLLVADPERSCAFYQERLGMEVLAHTSTDHARWFLGYPKQSQGGEPSKLPHTALELVHRPEFAWAPRQGDGYWKIGVTLPHVDLARQALMDAGVQVSQPAQFRDIGYLCHLTDPDGYCIELLQHTFERNHRPAPPEPGFVLGGAPTLGQITLRIKDPEPSLRFYEHLGLRLLSRQVVQPYQFTLYFLAFTDEAPPNPDLDAVENREWLWQRPYTTLELQHRWGTEAAEGAVYRVGPSTGFVGMGFAVDALEPIAQVLTSLGAAVDTATMHGAPALNTTDPDGYAVRLFQAVRQGTE